MRIPLVYSTRRLLAAGLLWSLPALAASPAPVRVRVGEAAREFAATDVAGQPVSLAALRGHKVLLLFMRNAGCPVCNRRMHELMAQSADFQARNLTVVAVYESSAARLREYLAQQPVPFTLLPDPEQRLYQLYGLEVSGGKALQSVFHGVMGKARAGKKLFTKPIEQDGNKNRIGAELLLDEQGRVAVAHYGRFIGDELPLADIQKFIR